MGHLWPLFLYFVFSTTNFTIFTTNQCENAHLPSMRYWDSNPQPSGHESPPITPSAFEVMSWTASQSLPSSIQQQPNLIFTDYRMTTCFSYYHTFGLTENYLIMIEQPWVANSLKLIASKVS